MLEFKFTHDYQAAIYDRFVLTIFKAGTEESTSEQVFSFHMQQFAKAVVGQQLAHPLCNEFLVS